MAGWMIALFVAAAVCAVALSVWLAAKRRKELAAWAESKGLRFSPGKDGGMDERFAEFPCLRRGTNRYAYNIIEGELAGRPLTAFDFHYETHSTGSKGRRETHRHHFSAAILGSALPLKALSIRPENLFDKIGEFFGFDDIDFESAEFSRKFHVKAQDRRWAYDALHARTMQFLLGMPKFAIQFGPRAVIVHRDARFRPPEFGVAVEVGQGILDRFPDYLVKQLREGA